MIQAHSEIAGNVIILSTISLLPLWVTENEAEGTREILPSERKLKNCLLHAGSLPKRPVAWTLSSGQKGSKIQTPTPCRDASLCYNTGSHELWPNQTFPDQPSLTQPLFQSLLLMSFEGSGEMRFLITKDQFFLKKLKIELPYDPAIPLLGHISGQSHNLKGFMHPNFHRSTTYNSQGMEVN